MFGWLGMLPHTFITFIQLLNDNKCRDRIFSYSTKQLYPSYTAASTFFLLTVQINRLPRVFFLTPGYLTYEIYILSQGGGDGKQPKDNSKEFTICLMFMTNKLNKFYLTSAGLTASHFLFLYSRGVKEGRKAPKKRIDIFL